MHGSNSSSRADGTIACAVESGIARKEEVLYWTFAQRPVGWSKLFVTRVSYQHREHIDGKGVLPQSAFATGDLSFEPRWLRIGRESSVISNSVQEHGKAKAENGATHRENEHAPSDLPARVNPVCADGDYRKRCEHASDDAHSDAIWIYAPGSKHQGKCRQKRSENCDLPRKPHGLLGRCALHLTLVSHTDDRRLPLTEKSRMSRKSLGNR
jgi:hypothetical protein